MHGLAEIKPFAGEESCAESTPCPACTAPLNEPKSAIYRGLGRIEHVWLCKACGESFHTTARMAGMIDLEPHEPAATAR
jgi:hypothetical protein